MGLEEAGTPAKEEGRGTASSFRSGTGCGTPKALEEILLRALTTR